jgi:hypothetical protein
MYLQLRTVSDVIMLEAIPETADVVALPDARHQPREGRPAMLSNMTKSSSWLGATHVKVYASGASLVPMASTVSGAW